MYISWVNILGICLIDDFSVSIRVFLEDGYQQHPLKTTQVVTTSRLKPKCSILKTRWPITRFGLLSTFFAFTYISANELI